MSNERYKGFDISLIRPPCPGPHLRARQHLRSVEGKMLAYLLWTELIQERLDVAFSSGLYLGQVRVCGPPRGLPTMVEITEGISQAFRPSCPVAHARDGLRRTINRWVEAREALRPHVRRLLKEVPSCKSPSPA